MSDKRALVIIPAFNEEKNILNVVKSIEEMAPNLDYIIVNDGSTDRTAEVCKENSLNVINLPFNLGIGGAVQTGYKYAKLKKYEIAIQIDGDGQHDPKYLEKLINKIDEGFDLVTGSRFIEKRGFQTSFMRRVGIWWFMVLTFICLKIKATDLTSGFRACNKKLIHSFSDYYPTDFPEPEAYAIVVKKGFKTIEVPVEMKERQSGESSINFCKSIYYMIKVTLAILIRSIQVYRS